MKDETIKQEKDQGILWTNKKFTWTIVTRLSKEAKHKKPLNLSLNKKNVDNEFTEEPPESIQINEDVIVVKGKKDAGFCEANWEYQSDKGDLLKFSIGIPKFEDNYANVLGNHPNLKLETTGLSKDGPNVNVTTTITQIK